MIRHMLVLLAVGPLAATAAHADPDCAGPHQWATNMTFAELKNEGVLASDTVDFDHVQTTLIASQRTGVDRWRQVLEVTFPLHAGGTVRAITVSDASQEECSMSDVTVYRIVSPRR